MAKINKKGRSNGVPFIRLHRGITGSEAWLASSCFERCLFIAVYGRHSGTNNGRISFSIREACEELHIGKATAQKAFTGLLEKGFLICRKDGSFSQKTGATEARAREWEVTSEPCDGKPPKSLYRNWPSQN